MIYKKEDANFLRPLINAYTLMPIHEITAIPGKISGALMLVNAITDAVPSSPDSRSNRMYLSEEDKPLSRSDCSDK